MNLANRLTVMRVMMIPIIVLIWLFPYEQFGVTIHYISIDFVSIRVINIIVLVLFSVASFTDFLDGHLARKNGWITNFGKFLDPIADKLLVNSLLILFAYDHLIPVVCLMLMIWRDTIVDGIRMLTATQGIVIAAGYLGKVKTVSQMVAIIVILLNNYPFELFNIPFASLMIWFATFMSVVSGISYLAQTMNIVLKQ